MEFTMPVPKYPHTIAQKIDYFLFSRFNKNEREQIDLLNTLDSEIGETYSRHRPQGFIDRLSAILNRDDLSEHNDKEISVCKELLVKREKSKQREILESATELARKNFKPKQKNKLSSDYIRDNPPNKAQIATLQKIWDVTTKREVVIKKGTTLYSGQLSSSHIVFDQMHGHNKFGQGMWLTDDFKYALDYALKGLGGDIDTQGHVLYSFKALRDIKVSELSQHPGELSLNHAEGDMMAGHHTFCTAYPDIIKPLVDKGKLSNDNFGHVRFDEQGQISELWVKEPNEKTLKIEEFFVLPNREDFADVFPKYRQQLSLSQLRREFQSNTMEQWLDFATLLNSYNGNISLKDMADMAGVDLQSGSIMKVLQSNSTYDPDLKLLTEEYLKLNQINTPKPQSTAVKPAIEQKQENATKNKPT
jgi:hypothetical protein